MAYLLKIVFIGFLIGLAISVITQIVTWFDIGRMDSMERILEILKYQMLYAIVLSLVNSLWFDYVNHKGKLGSLRQHRFSISFSGSVILTLVAIFFIRMFHEMVWGGETFSEFIEGEGYGPYLFSIGITLVIGLGFYSFYYYKEKQKTKVKEQTILAGTASAKFDALKNQLDPHFLFNSLNVLTSLIEENPKSAQKFTTSLSKVYRYVLEQKNKELVTVDEELDFARSYMSLLKMRFEDSIIFEIPEYASNPDLKVVPLSLQLLLENAVKHNMVNSSRPLNIKIYEQNDYLCVENSLQPKEVVKKSSGVGLSNIIQRYNLLTDKKMNIDKEKNRFRVAIPMIDQEVSVVRRDSARYEDSYIRARKRVDKIKEFYYSIISFCLVIPFLIFINYKTYWGFQWFWFPLIGWSIGLISDWYRLYVQDEVLGRNWEERQIQKYMQEEERKSNH